MATKVKIRTKPLYEGRESVYLDYYPAIKHPDTGKATRREFLKLFVYSTEQSKIEEYTDDNGKAQKRVVPILDRSGKPKKIILSAMQKIHNRETMAIAENVRSQRQIEIQAGEFGFLSKEKLNTNFVAYFEQLARKRKGSNIENWKSAILLFKEFSGGSVKVSELTEAYCNDYRAYVENIDHLKQNTKVAYFGKFKAALRQAYKDSLITSDLAAKTESLTAEDTRRNYLTQVELQTLAQTECEVPELKKAAMFSAFTGLRHCDIVAMTWGIIQRGDNGWLIKFTQRKTKKVENHPISDEAYELLGERGDNDTVVFESLTQKKDYWYNIRLAKWIKDAGITNKITFHCFRHTYATLLLSNEVDIYVISKLLGHKDIQTTQIYAHVMDKAKREAANKITLK